MSDDDRAWFDAQNERAMREYENRGQPEPCDDEESDDERADREAVETLRLQCKHLDAHAVIGGHVTLRREHAKRLLRMVVSNAVNAEHESGLHAEIAHLAAEVDEARREARARREIMEGRTTPPTNAEIVAHAKGGGRWRCVVSSALHLCADAMHGDAARMHRDTLEAAGHDSVWWATDGRARRRAGTCAHTFARCDVMAYVWL